jgi:hypothetical protein
MPPIHKNGSLPLRTYSYGILQCQLEKISVCVIGAIFNWFYGNVASKFIYNYIATNNASICIVLNNIWLAMPDIPQYYTIQL